MNTKFLFLDDIRQLDDVKWVKLPEGDWDIVRDYNSFVGYIKEKGLPAFISYDHDLSDDHYQQVNTITEDGEIKFDYTKTKEKTGYDCAKWLVEYCYKEELALPDYAVHSMNPIGKINIIGLIEGYRKFAQTQNEKQNP